MVPHVWPACTLLPWELVLPRVHRTCLPLWGCVPHARERGWDRTFHFPKEPAFRCVDRVPLHPLNIHFDIVEVESAFVLKWVSIWNCNFGLNY